MKKQDILIVVLLIALMLGWPMIYGRLFPGRPEEAPVPSQTQAIQEPAGDAAIAAATPAADSRAGPPLPAPVPPATPASLHSLSNDQLQAVFSSHGGGLQSVTLSAFRQTAEQDSPPVTLDFGSMPALIYDGLAGLTADSSFSLQEADDGLRVTAMAPQNLHFSRHITLDDDYQLIVRDELRNAGDQALALPAMRLSLGAMHDERPDTLGIDALPSVGGKGVVYWAKRIPGLLKNNAGLMQVDHAEQEPVDWLAVKNKFFVQILATQPEADGYRLLIERTADGSPPARGGRSSRAGALRGVAAALEFAPQTLESGGVTVREIRYYAGPKKFSILRKLGRQREEVMAFGFWSPVCKLLLFLLNQIHRLLPNYGLAIIILTLLIRTLFWPLTHKSTQSMKKMQTIQPLIAELRQKYKDNPRKLQQETMELYKKHKINPVGGCLPMLIQIPVFIALFVVLRSAVELRLAGFLWIRDLSEPEGLLAGILPIPLNILPILMAVTQAWQQQLTPAGDPSQRKMFMVVMPLMMLIMFYNMPAALVLYWTANTSSMILQQLLQKRIEPLKERWQRVTR